MDELSGMIVVLITAPSLVAAEKIGKELVDRKLAACVNILPGMKSIYRWEDQVQQDEEVLMVVKTRSKIFHSRLVPAVEEIHPYDVPEIIALPITAGAKPYLDWIRQSTL